MLKLSWSYETLPHQADKRQVQSWSANHWQYCLVCKMKSPDLFVINIWIVLIRSKVFFHEKNPFHREWLRRKGSFVLDNPVLDKLFVDKKVNFREAVFCRGSVPGWLSYIVRKVLRFLKMSEIIFGYQGNVGKYNTPCRDRHKGVRE